MSKKESTFDFKLRYNTVARLTREYSSLLKRIRGSDLYYHICSNKSLSDYNNIINTSLEYNKPFKFLRDYFKGLCGDDNRASERYKYYYIKTIFTVYSAVISKDTGGNWIQLANLIGICANVDRFKEDPEVSGMLDNLLLSDIQELTFYLSALFMLYQKLDGYQEIILSCIENGDIAQSIRDIICKE